ncbi:MAG TPA: S41 family peptidase [Burkholderiales bacterium]|nr:S41 family peptidase [Burkholderiales bacterium]
MSTFFRTLPALAAAWLFAAAGAVFAAAAPIPDELLAPLTSAYMRAVTPGQQADLHRDLFETVLRRVHRSYAREVDVAGLIEPALKAVASAEPQTGDPADVFRKTINAALASLDPHSRYLDPRAQRFQRSAITGSFGGLGVRVEMVDGLVRVLEPMPNTPAARAGLQSGDFIVGLDGEPVQGMTLQDAMSRMRGVPGTAITLTIRRATRLPAEFDVSVVRETIRTEPLRWSMQGDVLVLRLATFNGSTAAALEKALDDVTAQGAPRAIVLDLRGNPGGLLNQAVLTADAFLGAGDIVSLRGRTLANQRTWRADAAEHLAGVPMVVLIDGRSASAAELVAAALQENGRALVMGQRSFGKGSVQSIVALGEGKGALRLTTALYHGPSGRTVQRTGVEPDIELIPPLAKTVSPRRREADRERALPGTDEPPPAKARIDQSRCAGSREDLDPGLACALAFIEAGEIDRFVAALPAAQ